MLSGELILSVLQVKITAQHSYVLSATAGSYIGPRGMVCSNYWFVSPYVSALYTRRYNSVTARTKPIAQLQ